MEELYENNNIGDLVTDYYYKNDKLVRVNRVCDNDMTGKIAIDVSKPTYSEDAMNIYFYKGNL